MKESCKKYLINVVEGKQKGIFPVFLKPVLWVLSVIYVLLQAIYGLLFALNILPSTRLPKPVISIGNITLGGTGKTPITIWLARKIQAAGFKPAILIRGYMAGDAGSVESDEAKMLKDELPGVPVLVGRDRKLAALEFLKNQKADVFILDDGFQHRPLKRDLDVVVINATNPWGNGHVLPRGLLREPRQSLSRAQVILLSKSNLIDHMQLNRLKNEISKYPASDVCEGVFVVDGFEDVGSKEKYPISFLSQKKAIALCGIGDPASFLRNLNDAKVEVVKSFIYLDHHVYTGQEVRDIIGFCLNNEIGAVVTTQKDSVKLIEFLPLFESIKLLTLKIRFEMTYGEQGFLKRTFGLLPR